VLFGPKHLIEASKELGQYIRRIQEFKEELQDDLTRPPAKQEPAEKLPSITGSTTEKKG
jgi:Sec-independent protein translocase protein TatA